VLQIGFGKRERSRDLCKRSHISKLGRLHKLNLVCFSAVENPNLKILSLYYRINLSRLS